MYFIYYVTKFFSCHSKEQSFSSGLNSGRKSEIFFKPIPLVSFARDCVLSAKRCSRFINWIYLCGISNSSESCSISIWSKRCLSSLTFTFVPPVKSSTISDIPGLYSLIPTWSLLRPIWHWLVLLIYFSKNYGFFRSFMQNKKIRVLFVILTQPMRNVLLNDVNRWYSIVYEGLTTIQCFELFPILFWYWGS